MSSDHLYHWKKHSGFKKGLATDIRFGDDRKWKGNVQFATTMHSDYSSQAEPTFLKSQLDPSVYIPQGPAGKPLGVDFKNKLENHIAFGDSSVKNDARFSSLTATDYQPFVINGNSLKLTSKLNSSPIEKYHTKSCIATSAAHIGLETRRDLPIDDQHFKCFTTSNSDAFVHPLNYSEKIENPTNFKPTSRVSNVQQGDRHHETNYSTIHATSFIKHEPNSYKIEISGKSMHGSKGFMNPENGPQLDYTTTSAETFASRNIHLMDASTVKHSDHTKSFIVFGDETKTNFHPSVTQQDYPIHALEHRNSPKLKTFKSSVSSALQPNVTNYSWKDIESCTSSAYQPLSNEWKQEEWLAAGIETGSKGKSNQSSIPCGDANLFDFTSCQTTHANEFQRYSNIEKQLPCKKYAKSNVSLGEIDGPLDSPKQERYKTTTNDAFVHHSASIAALGRGVSVKPKSTLETGENNATDPFNATTTHQDHYQKPAYSGKQAQAIPAKVVPKKMLFPLRSMQSFITETSNAFSMRPQLYTWDSQQKKNQREAASRLGTKSSIALADPTFTFHATNTMKI